MIWRFSTLALTTPKRTIPKRATATLALTTLAIAALSGCGPSYSPDTYATNAAQQANKVDPGVVVGVRKVGITAAGTVGTVTGAAAGGIAGAQLAAGPVNAFTALGGSLVGGIAGSTVEHVTADTVAFEYIIRKPNGDLVSVTQKDKTPLALGQKVLVITGAQARVVPDYTVSIPLPAAKTTEPGKPDTASSDTKPADAQPPDKPQPPDASAKPPDAPKLTAKPADTLPSADVKAAAPAPSVPE